jgi:hypothetical protein
MIDRVLDTDGDPPVADQFNQNPMLRVTRGPLHDRQRMRGPPRNQRSQGPAVLVSIHATFVATSAAFKHPVQFLCANSPGIAH